jgi:hypothetical protein
VSSPMLCLAWSTGARARRRCKSVGKRWKHKDPMCLRPHRVQRRHQLMHETKFIVTSASRNAKKNAEALIPLAS